ncbi:MAG: DNA primase [Clostridium perfringens]|nr:DNA primase [Clostridium perfringens]
MPIPEHIIEKVKEENDIVDVISDVVRLKRTGRNYSGLCPFHHEKTPSFSVSQDKQIFKCFGCGETGNVISFVMKNKSMTFPEAVGYLADRANITLEFEDKKLSKIQRKKENIYKINTLMGRYYYNNLSKSKIAKEYFFRRGITENILKKFGLGYSLDGWQNVVNYLKRVGINENLILETGFVIKSDKGRIYDRFRNRVMFPVFDHNGKVIGFGGRVLDDSKPKYLNSPETILFQKGTNLYGLNFAIKGGLLNKEIIIVEGYMDCISLHQYGITNAVASLGTALTEKQSRLLKRYVDKVIIAYDADVAGQMATLRGLEILKEAGLEVSVLNIPMGKDPDEFIRANGKEAFLTLVKNSEKLMDYKLRKAKEGLNFSNSKDIDIYSQRLVDIFKFLDPLERSVYIKKVSEDTKFSEQVLIDLLNKKIPIDNKNEYKMNNMKEYGTKLNIEPIYIKWERSVIKLLCKEKWHKDIKNSLTEDDFIDETHKELMKLILNILNDTEFENLDKKIEIKCENPNLLKEWLNVRESEFLDNFSDIETFIKDYKYRISKYKLEEQNKKIKHNLDIFVKEGNMAKAMELVKKSKDISDKLKELERSK